MPRISTMQVRVDRCRGARARRRGRDRRSALRRAVGREPRNCRLPRPAHRSSRRGLKAWTLRRPARNALDREARPAAHRLSGARSTTPTAFRSRCFDTSRCGRCCDCAQVLVRLLRIAAQVESRRIREGRKWLRAGGAATEDGDPDGQAAVATCLARGLATAPSIGEDPLPRSEKSFAEQTPTRTDAIAGRGPKARSALLAVIAAAHHARSGRSCHAVTYRARPASSREFAGGATPRVSGIFPATPWAQLRTSAAIPDGARSPLDQTTRRIPTRRARTRLIVESSWSAIANGARRVARRA